MVPNFGLSNYEIPNIARITSNGDFVLLGLDNLLQQLNWFKCTVYETVRELTDYQRMLPRTSLDTLHVVSLYLEATGYFELDHNFLKKGQDGLAAIVPIIRSLHKDYEINLSLDLTTHKLEYPDFIITNLGLEGAIEIDLEKAQCRANLKYFFGYGYVKEKPMFAISLDKCRIMSPGVSYSYMGDKQEQTFDSRLTVFSEFIERLNMDGF